jgi:hypothetical protein
MLLSGFYHDNLGMVPAFDVLGLGDPLRGNSFWMVQSLVADFALVQTVDESLRNPHNRPPVQTITFSGDLYIPELDCYPERKRRTAPSE